MWARAPSEKEIDISLESASATDFNDKATPLRNLVGKTT